jgi:hypothetical protein
MTEQEKVELTPVECVLTTKRWLEAVLVQSCRIYDLLGVFSKLRLIKDSEDYVEIDALNRKLNGLQVEEHFFLIAVAKANVWINLARESGAVSGPVIRRYLSAIEPALAVRNMREHDDRYLTGDGDKQEKFIHHSSDGAVVTDGTSSAGSVEKWMIAGRVDVRSIEYKTHKVLELFEESLKTIRKKQSDDLRDFLKAAATE